MDYPELIKDQLVGFKAEEIKSTVSEALSKGVGPLEIVDSLWEGMKDVGRRYETGEFFFSELTMAGKTMKEAMLILHPVFEKKHIDSEGEGGYRHSQGRST